MSRSTRRQIFAERRKAWSEIDIYGAEIHSIDVRRTMATTDKQIVMLHQLRAALMVPYRDAWRRLHLFLAMRIEDAPES